MLNRDEIWNRTYKRHSVTPTISVMSAISLNQHTNTAKAFCELRLEIVEQSSDARFCTSMTPAEMRALAAELEDRAGTLEKLEAEAEQMNRPDEYTPAAA